MVFRGCPLPAAGASSPPQGARTRCRRWKRADAIGSGASATIRHPCPPSFVQGQRVALTSGRAKGIGVKLSVRCGAIVMLRMHGCLPGPKGRTIPGRSGCCPDLPPGHTRTSRPEGPTHTSGSVAGASDRYGSRFQRFGRLRCRAQPGPSARLVWAAPPALGGADGADRPPQHALAEPSLRRLPRALFRAGNHGLRPRRRFSSLT